MARHEQRSATEVFATDQRRHRVIIRREHDVDAVLMRRIFERFAESRQVRGWKTDRSPRRPRPSGEADQLVVRDEGLVAMSRDGSDRGQALPLAAIKYEDAGHALTIA
jgi:hypothetical protein